MNDGALALSSELDRDFIAMQYVDGETLDAITGYLASLQ